MLRKEKSVDAEMESITWALANEVGTVSFAFVRKEEGNRAAHSATFVKKIEVLLVGIILVPSSSLIY